MDSHCQKALNTPHPTYTKPPIQTHYKLEIAKMSPFFGQLPKEGMIFWYLLAIIHIAIETLLH